MGVANLHETIIELTPADCECGRDARAVRHYWYCGPLARHVGQWRLDGRQQNLSLRLRRNSAARKNHGPRLARHDSPARLACPTCPTRPPDQYRPARPDRRSRPARPTCPTRPTRLTHPISPSDPASRRPSEPPPSEPPPSEQPPQRAAAPASRRPNDPPHPDPTSRGRRQAQTRRVHAKQRAP